MNRFLAACWILSMASCTPDPGSARNFRVIFDHYRSAEHVSALSFPPSIALSVLGDDSGQQATRELLMELSAFYMLLVEEEGSSAGIPVAENVRGYTQRLGFEDLFRIRSGSSQSFIKILESEGFVREAVMIFEQDEALIVMDLKGNIRLERFLQLAETGILESLPSPHGLD